MKDTCLTLIAAGGLIMALLFFLAIKLEDTLDRGVLRTATNLLCWLGIVSITTGYLGLALLAVRALWGML